MSHDPLALLDPETRKRYDALCAHLLGLESVAVAFSGGVDSTLLVTVAHRVLRSNMLAVTSAGRAVPARDIERAQQFCEERGIPHVVVEFDELTLPGFVRNQPDRCYHCKRALFTNMLETARQRGFSRLVDGSNKDDEGDYRPGLKALEELGVGSPLREVCMTKAQVREISHALDLPTWNAPSAACLASRVAYGETITAEKLARVSQAEYFLHIQGFDQLRVRMHGSQGELARIEVEASQIARLADGELRERIVTRLRELGFRYVSLDLAGFRTGSMNEVL